MASQGASRPSASTSAHPSVAATVNLNRATASNGTVGVGLKNDSNAEQQMRQAIRQLVYSVDPTARLEPEAETALLDVASEFVDSVSNFSSRLARHRGSDSLDVKDLQLHLERHHRIKIPGFTASEDLQRIPAFPGSTVAVPTSTGQSGAASANKAAKDKDKTATGATNSGHNLRSKRVAAAKAASNIAAAK